MNNRGFTIPEAILGIVIMLVALFGLLRAFTFATGYIERIGIQRQAIALIQGEYEKVRKYSQGGIMDLAPLAKEDALVELKSDYNKKERLVEGWLGTAVEDGSDEDGLRYQHVTISLRYEYENVEDTITIPARFYRDQQ